MALTLHTLICSTRPSRHGPAIAAWAHERAVQHAKFDAVLVDLASFNLPIFDEPEPPRLGRYVHEHTKKWSASVAAADAFVFVTPEYNHGPPPSLLNAMTYLHREWQYKPVAFVSYGGQSGGGRGVQITRQIVTTLRMVSVFDSVAIPFFTQQLKDGRFEPTDGQNTAATTMLNELHRWATALQTMRS